MYQQDPGLEPLLCSSVYHLIKKASQLLRTSSKPRVGLREMDPMEKRSPSSSDPGTTYQVFLSFRGLDIHPGFIDVLNRALTDAGVYVFRDDEELRQGEEIGDEILRAIDQSRVFIPIFSKGYASSKWCLMELGKMFESMREASSFKKKIMPIFFDVTIDDVMLKTKLYAGALTKHRMTGKFSVNTVRQWKEVLRGAGKIKGYELMNQGYAEFAKSFVKEVSLKLKVIHTLVTDFLVQRDDQVEALMKLLDIDSPGVRFFGIHGMGGIGKTTLARVVFNKLCHRFDQSCFLADVCESSMHHHGIEKLQQQILDSAGLKFGKVPNKYDGSMRIRGRLPQKKLLLVLDDIGHDEQMEYLVGDTSWFGSGSRIIITTRDKSVLRGNIQFLEVERMKPEVALRLFSMHAFGQESPLNDYLSLSEEVVESTGRVPLALEVIGSLLWKKRDRNYWLKVIDRLNKSSHKDVWKKLMISYEALEDGAKQIFLDIACFFNRHDRTYPMYMWHACEFDPEVGLEELIDMSLVKIVVERDFMTREEHEKLRMHDQLRDMGRIIAGRNRIWREEEALEVIQTQQGSDEIQAIYLKKNDDGHMHLNPKAFKKMSRLRMLILRGCHFSCGPSYLPNELRWLDWENYPSPSLPPDFDPRNLTVLRLFKSRITKLWNRQQIGPNLTVMDLSASESLLEIPDVSGMPNLKELRADQCRSLIMVHESVGSMEKLEFLSFSGCWSLRKFPAKLILPSLRQLRLHGCEKIEKFSDILGTMEYLEKLDLSGTPIKELAPAVEFSTRLQSLRLSNTKLKALPKYIYHLPNLKELDLSGCSSLLGFMKKEEELEEVEGDSTSRSFSNTFPNLVELNLFGSNITSLSPRISKCYYLKKLILARSKQLKDIRELPPRLEFLDASMCKSLETVGVESLRAMGKIRMDFYNCDELRGREELGSEMLWEWLKGLEERMISFPELLEDYAEDYPFELLVPGRDIPDRFYHGRSRVGQNRLNFWVHSQSRVLKEPAGFALFAAFSGKCYASCYCKWLIKINGERVYTQGEMSYIGAVDNVWIVYIHFKKHWKEMMLLVDGGNLFSFEVEIPDNHFSPGLLQSKISLKSSGVAFIGRSGEDFNFSTDQIEYVGPEEEIADQREVLAPKVAMTDKLKFLRPKVPWAIKPDDEDMGNAVADYENITDNMWHVMEEVEMYTDPEASEIMEDRVEEPRKELDTESKEINSGALALHAEVVLSFSTEKESMEVGNLLFEDLKHAGIHVTEVHEKLFKDEVTDKKFLRAVDNSKIYVPIITKAYISSARCLSELAYVVDSWREVAGQLVVPIFYGVEPLDLQVETNLQIFPSETLGQWKEALRKIAGIPGLQFKAEGFKKHSKFVMRVILNELKGGRGGSVLVGMEDRVEKLRKELGIESKGAVFVGIHGIGGIGKTTLAKAVFDELCTHFEGCSFISDIGETSKHRGLNYLQDKLSRDIEGADTDRDVSSKIPGFLKKKVLIVLDNVDDREQIKKLVGMPNRFVSGSRIIITTKDINLLAVEHETLHGRILEWPEGIRKYKMEEMKLDDALKLFCSYAFGEVHPQDGYYRLCEQFVSTIGGHPLALEIIGSFLSRQPKHAWKKTLDTLRKSDRDLHRILMISYEALELETKEVFLDIACFFTGSQKSAPMYMWKACDLLPELRIKVLILCSFVKVLDDNRLWMHDEVRDFGRKIACGGTIIDPAKGSRFWVNMDVLNILWSTEEYKNVRGLRLCYGDFVQDCTLPTGNLGSMPNLRFLELSGFPSAVKRDLPQLRWLSLHYSLEDVKATDVYRDKLVILDLSKSPIKDQWVESGKLGDAKKLKILNLTGCEEITKTPVFSEDMILERLILEDCVNLVEIDQSIGNLKQLMYLDLKGCNSLEELPDEVGSAKALTELVLKGNGQSFKLNKSAVGLASLSVLQIDNVKIIDELTFGVLEKLEILTLSECAGIEELPQSIRYFTSLVKLDISGSNIAQLPDSIGEMTNLEVVNIGPSMIKELPKSIWKLKKLQELRARRCRNLQGEIPIEIEGLSSLRILDLSFTEISSVPSTLSQLVNLKTLNLESCHELVELPLLPTSLVSLHVLSKKLKILSDFPEMNRLINLQLLGPVDNFQADWIEKLSGLEKLELFIPNFTALRFNELSLLRSLSLSCREIDTLPQLPSTLSRLCLAYLEKSTEFTGLCKLQRLTFLEFYRCSLGRDQCRSLRDELKSLEHLSATKCRISSINEKKRPKRKAGLPLPEGLRVLSMKECKLPGKEIDLSKVKNLLHLELIECELLTEIRGLEELKSLERASISGCNSLKRIGDVSNLKSLETLQIENCTKLKEVTGLGRIKSLNRLEIYGCSSMNSSPSNS